MQLMLTIIYPTIIINVCHHHYPSNILLAVVTLIVPELTLRPSLFCLSVHVSLSM